MLSRNTVMQYLLDWRSAPMKINRRGLLFVLLASPLRDLRVRVRRGRCAPAAGEQQEDSVAAAARRAREQKKNGRQALQGLEQ